MREDEMLMFLLTLVRATSDLAVRCEGSGGGAENAEALAGAGDSLRIYALTLICADGRDVVSDCAARLEETASERGASFALGFADRAAANNGVTTWRELQLVEEKCSRACDPSSVAIGPFEQMCRRARSLAIVAGRVAEHLDMPLRDDPGDRTPTGLSPRLPNASALSEPPRITPRADAVQFILCGYSVSSCCCSRRSG